MFDAGVGATHLLNPTAAEALAIVQEVPGLVDRPNCMRALLARLEHRRRTSCRVAAR